MDQDNFNIAMGVIEAQRNQALNALVQVQVENELLKKALSALRQQLQAKDDVSHLAPAQETPHE